MVACAVVVLVMFHQNKSSPIFLILAVVLVLLAIIARLSSLGTTIAIERDWVVVIAKENKSMLAGKMSLIQSYLFKVFCIISVRLYLHIRSVIMRVT